MPAEYIPEKLRKQIIKRARDYENLATAQFSNAQELETYAPKTIFVTCGASCGSS